MKMSLWYGLLMTIFLVSPVHSIPSISKIRGGAVLYMNHCSGCHSLHYAEYDPLLESFKLTAWANGKSNRLTSNAPYQTSLSSEDAIRWFGRTPPDLSLITLQKTKRWVYQYLMDFYPDKHQPFGVNNTILPNTHMPDPLFEQDPELAEQIVDFLEYVSDPSVLIRYRMGPWVLLMGFVFFGLLYQLKKLYWKKIQSPH